MKRIFLIIFSAVLIAVIAFFLFRMSSGNSITFNEQIAPVLYKNCSSCHHTGGSAPFALVTYQEVLKRSKLIRYVTQARLMPPWPADPAYSHFASEKTLTDQEIEWIKDWVDAGAPQGDPSGLSDPPLFNDSSVLGRPDLVLKIEPYFIKGNNKDDFLFMKIPFEITQDTFIRAIEFVPGNRKLVHHVNGHLLRYEYEKKKNVYDGEKAVDTQTHDVKEAYEMLKLSNDDGTYPTLVPSFSNYLPGVEPVLYPEGIGGFFVTKKGAIFLKDIHYGPSSVSQYDRSYFNIFFDSKPPQRAVREIQLGTLGISKIVPPLIIPPNEVKTFHTQTIAPMDMSVLTINPHMHLLGKKFLAYAITPAGDTIRLIRINNWDFRWQYFYTFKKIVKIPQGSLIYAEGVYDNTASNPLNPFHPPRTVSEREGSMRTSDEMFQFIITYLPYQKGDEDIVLDGNHQN